MNPEYERGEHHEYQSRRLNRNTQVISPGWLPDNYLVQTATPKVKNRLWLNQAGLNGLATTVVVHPDSIFDHPDGLLENILKFSNSINHAIGLQSSHDLIIRSSSVKRSDQRTARFSEPAVLAADLNTPKPSFKLLSGMVRLEGQNYYQPLRGSDYLLIHDDNESLQPQSLQGRICQTPEGNEIIIATNILHPRGIGEKRPDYPYMIIHPAYLEDLGLIKPDQLASAAQTSSVVSDWRTEYKIFNCSYRTAYLMLKKLLREQYLIRDMFAHCQEHYGPESVMEFRSYNILEGGIGQKIHVLDVNTGF